MRGHNEGSVYKHKKKNLWCASISFKLPSGKTARKYSYAKTQSEAIQKLRVLHAQADAGRFSSPERSTLASYLEWWLETIAWPNFRFATWRYYKGLVNNHIIPRVGCWQLNELTEHNVDELLLTIKDQKTSGPASARLRQQVYDLLKKVLGAAVRRRIVSHNVCDSVDRPKAPKAEISPLDELQANTLLQVARNDRFYVLYLLALNTGLRWGELAGLRWKDVNTKDHMISLQRAIITAKVKLQDGVAKERPLPAETKSKRGRHIAIPDFVSDALRQHQKSMMNEGHLDYVFCDKKGGALRESNFLRRSFKPLLAKLEELLPVDRKLPNGIRFHDLRHTHATFLLKAGVHPKIVSERLGHATVAITLDLYSHVLPSMQRPAVQAMNRLFGPVELDAGPKVGKSD